MGKPPRPTWLPAFFPFSNHHMPRLGRGLEQLGAGVVPHGRVRAPRDLGVTTTVARPGDGNLGFSVVAVQSGDVFFLLLINFLSKAETNI